MAESDPGFRQHWKCALACTLVSMAPFQYGMDFGLIGGLQAMVGFLKVFGYVDPETPVGYNISTVVQQLISSLMTLGAFLGSLLAGPMSIKLGRKPCLWIASLICGVANAIMLGTTSLGALYFARLLIGIGNGFFMTFSQLYLQECAPARYRGTALAAFSVWVTFGSLVATVVDNFTSVIDGRAAYMIPLALVYLVPVILTVGLLFVPESPRYLVIRQKEEQARKALIWLRPKGTNVDVEMAKIRIAVQQEREHAQRSPWVEMATNPVERRRTLLAIGSVTTQAASGAMYMISYGTYFFEMADVGSPFMNACILTAVGCLAMVIDLFIIAPYGRRRVFMTGGLVFCGVCELVMAIVYTKQPGTEATGKVTVALSVLYVFVYNGAISPFSWLAGGELPSQRLRSHAFGLAAAVGFIGAWLASFTAPYFINPDALGWGPRYGYVWFPSCLAAAAFVYFCLPETKDRTLEEIDEMFEARLPARKFRGYQCTVNRQAEKVVALGNDPGISLEKPVMEAAAEMVEDVRHRKS